MSPTRHLVIFCDGTWIGRETEVEDAPPSNIRMLANMVGTVEFSPTSSPPHPTLVHPITSSPNVTAGYQEGIGLNQPFASYL
ncbi:hypothetical protein CC80DRAFT_596210 [Byssothecium circinans]|uniref:Uncharacterized protein n=1 Tax=Byssothecium circinans TaxID=147558 RepID=A0A6A5TL05_9PLEO|nr:hypothetical protein CC80DRAFT_596210 [Byssothecium circinans]